ncbi:hypothetical protein BST95_02970 [Halioglobus japonicus]|uniref:Phospholipase n=1 Tax=Halioglobus japonicus TaxID=930805 RepID=A0AAP8MCJ9_9GAMM|nr:phospholipase D-like domain-containing protein [Halioglobus japonicus]AQA17344.1 hypothetical protein BST95_02970 [Halioglobus japonicus]PLW85265.1 phospholipase [Halioglobus japonicus]GHD22617.1 phospholipase D family protein [Halioglobus japonicus]
MTRCLATALLLLLVSACATTNIPADQCPADRQALENCPPTGAIDDPNINEWYRIRSSLTNEELGKDPLQIGIDASIPVKGSQVKLLGSREQDAIRSLVTKVHLIEEALYSVDAVYYIFKADLAGLAIMGAMCDAVKRGVDIRLMVDAIGSMTLSKRWLRALHSCEREAGFIRNKAGEMTTRRARIQVFLFNAPSKSPFTVNRRSHDKLMVVDGFVPEIAKVITGGRNVSLSYYGIKEDGSPNPDTYNDAEILLRARDMTEHRETVGAISEIYFSLLSLHETNRRIRSRQFITGLDLYTKRRERFKESLNQLKSLSRIQPYFADMEVYLSEDWRDADVQIAHEFANLTNRKVITDAANNLANNPNSIIYQLEQVRELDDRTHIRVVSPYLFLAKYYDKQGNLFLDEAQRILDWLAEAPEHRYEMITNSVLTSDNAAAQAIVDMDMAPRMLLGKDYKHVWQREVGADETSHELVGSDTWLKLVNHPQLQIYETGKLDDVALGGDKHYGKLHAKYLIGDKYGFIGTANFDHRSRLFNNEMGFLFESEGLRQDLIDEFERLKNESYLWGSPEWLEMRRQVIEAGGMKGTAVRNQRRIFRTLRATGLEYQF